MGIIRELRAIILADMLPYQHVVKGKRFCGYYRIFPGFRFTCWLRIHEATAGRKALRLLASVAGRRLRRLSLLTGIQINPGTCIGKGLYIPHHGTIVVNPGSTIGEKCYLSHNVTIGKAHTGKRAGVPKIGNDVFIGTGAVLLGRIRVGNNAFIGANAVVIDDVPDDVFVAGAPAKIVAHKTKSEILGHN